MDQQNRINELYSNADGTMQFIELSIGPLDSWSGVTLTSSRNGTTNLVTFHSPLPGWLTPNTTLLLATRSFAERAHVQPDYVIPDQFLFSLGGTLKFGDLDAFDHATLLSADSLTSVSRDGTATAPSPRNSHGESAALPEPLPLTAASMEAIKAWNAQQSAEVRAGDHTINGGPGPDTVVYPLARSDYTLRATTTPGDYALDKPEAAGTDILTGIERLQFSDVHVALGLDFIAGPVVKLLGAVFGREAIHNKEYVGIGLSLVDSGMYSYHRLATLAVEMSGKSSPADVVTLLWTNLVGSTPSAAEAAPYIAMLDEGWGVGTLAMLAAEHPLNLANIDLAGLAQTGLEYIPYTG